MGRARASGRGGYDQFGALRLQFLNPLSCLCKSLAGLNVKLTDFPFVCDVDINPLNGRCVSIAYYRRRAKARQEAALGHAEAFTRQLQAELAIASRCQAIAAGIIAELAGAPILGHIS